MPDSGRTMAINILSRIVVAEIVLGDRGSLVKHILLLGQGGTVGELTNHAPLMSNCCVRRGGGLDAR